MVTAHPATVAGSLSRPAHQCAGAYQAGHINKCGDDTAQAASGYILISYGLVLTVGYYANDKHCGEVGNKDD